MNPWASYALVLAKRGFYVFPLVPQSKAPAIKRWPSAATTDAERLRLWGEEFPNGNIAIATGRSGLVVIDVDIRDGGVESYRNLATEVGLEKFERAPRVNTPSGGFHLYFAAPTGTMMKSRVGVLSGVDVRAHGGYVVAPPSRSPIGDWRWERWNEDGTIPTLPPLVADWLVRRTAEVKQSVSPRIRIANHPIPKGRRNSTLLSIAGSLTRLGLSSNAISSALESTNDERCVPPLEERQIDAIVRSSAKWGCGFDVLAFLETWVPRLSGRRNAVVLLTFLAHWAAPDGSSTPAIAFIEKSTGLPQQQISSAARYLEKEAALERKFRFGAATTYKLKWPSEPTNIAL